MMATLKQLKEVMVHVKDPKQLSGKRKTGTTVHAGIDDEFAKKHNQEPYFSVTHDEQHGNRFISAGIASKKHIRSVGNSPEDRNDLMKIQKMHLRSAVTGEPMHGKENAYFHAGIGKYAPAGGNHEHLSSHLGISHEHSKEIISQVHAAPDDSSKKAIVNSHYEKLKPKMKADAHEAHAAIARLSGKY